MRVRKFRAFVKQVNKMIYSENSYPKGNSDYRFVASEDHKKGLGVEYFTNRTEYVNQYGGVVLLPDWRVFTDEEAPVTEYTGLKDKNGREIYEGDILEETCELYTHFGKTPTGRFHTSYVKVIWIDEGWGYEVINNNGKGLINGYKAQGLKITAKYSVVYGNIYENPELLGAAE
ncbi:YopX family protein [Bacillus licheniformis]|uniref:YopX family protein n=2 Tax=Bacillus licheniformis TaxID=1402 RepID=UPI00371F7ECE